MNYKENEENNLITVSGAYCFAAECLWWLF